MPQAPVSPFASQSVKGLALWPSVAGRVRWRAGPMKIAIPKERRAYEDRVAASPDTVKRLVGMGHEVIVESGAGAGAAFPDPAYTAAGATIAGDAAAAFGAGEVVLKVQRPILDEGADELRLMKPGTVLIATLQALQHPADVEAYAKAGI